MPAESESDGIKSVTLELVDRPPRRNPWRPTVLTIRKFLRICHLVEQGFAISRACEVECITYSRFRFRVARSTRLQERLRKAEETRFNLRHEQALESIMAAGERSWLAHAWWLERCLPPFSHRGHRYNNASRKDVDASFRLLRGIQKSNDSRKNKIRSC